MDIDQINRRHYIETDMHLRIGYGLASKLLSYEDGIISIELEIRKKWELSYNSAAYEIAHCWKNGNPEFAHAFMAKVYIIDSRKYNYKRSLLHLGIQPGYDAKKGVALRNNSKSKLNLI